MGKINRLPLDLANQIARRRAILVGDRRDGDDDRDAGPLPRAQMDVRLTGHHEETKIHLRDFRE